MDKVAEAAVARLREASQYKSPKDANGGFWTIGVRADDLQILLAEYDALRKAFPQLEPATKRV